MLPVLAHALDVFFLSKKASLPVRTSRHSVRLQPPNEVDFNKARERAARAFLLSSEEKKASS